MEDLEACGLTPEEIEIFRVNCELAEKINREALADPTSPYAHKFVGIANGEVVVVTEDENELGRRLREAEPNNHRVCWIEASRDYSVVLYV